MFPYALIFYGKIEHLRETVVQFFLFLKSYIDMWPFYFL